MQSPNASVTLSVRIPPEMRDQLDDLSASTCRTKSFLASEAIEHYLSAQAWQVKAIQAAVKKADSKDAKFIDHQRIVDWVDSWDSDDEVDAPE